mmetsp:Transcript_31152/g.27545  ORF Transcript_31152/g.27545 Transcript_31152/m.27545 type:complete len:84 (-) Transcript_31152:29-280(-)
MESSSKINIVSPIKMKQQKTNIMTPELGKGRKVKLIGFQDKHLKKLALYLKSRRKNIKQSLSKGRDRKAKYHSRERRIYYKTK